MFERWRRGTNEAENYLKATDAVSRPVAFMLTLAGLIIVASLLFMVFLGGRWAYTRIRNSDRPEVATANTSETASESNTTQQLPSFQSENPANTSTTESSSQNTSSNTASEAASTNTSTAQTQPAATTTPAATSTNTSPTPTATSTSTTAATSSVPDTGPGSVLATLVGVFVISVAGHQIFIRRYDSN